MYILWIIKTTDYYEPLTTDLNRNGCARDPDLYRQKY